MRRALPIILAELLAVIAAWAIAPWFGVPLAAIGLFTGGWLTSRRDDERGVHKHIAWRVGLVNGLAMAGSWWVVGGADPQIAAYGMAVRIGLAAAIAVGTGLAAMGIALIGLDARFIAGT